MTMQLGFIGYFLNTFVLIFLAFFAAKTKAPIRFFLAYCLFFITPFFTYLGLLGPLTGFDGTGNTTYFGLSFLTPFLAMMLIAKSGEIIKKPLPFFLTAANPAYMVCGPIPNAARFRFFKNWRDGWRKLKVLHKDFIIGLFFVSVIAPSFQSMLLLKTSTHPLDVGMFGLLFEGYVYFNFSGYSMIAWSIFRIFGADVSPNFSTPFSSKTVVEYWKNWHISFGKVLRQIFYSPLRPYVGIQGAAIATFMASAVWHGVTPNFLAWGIFHSFCWISSQWLFSRKCHAWSQYFLLLFSIVVGRVLFAESDFDFLTIKLIAIFDPVEWKSEMMLGGLIQSASIKRVVFLVFGFLLIFFEILKNNKKSELRGYRHLKGNGFVALMVVCIFFAGSFSDSGALYGQR